MNMASVSNLTINSGQELWFQACVSSTCPKGVARLDDRRGVVGGVCEWDVAEGRGENSRHRGGGWIRDSTPHL